MGAVSTRILSRTPESNNYSSKHCNFVRNTMSKNTVQIDARREEFRKYLEKEGILESLTKVLVALYEEPDKPLDALSFVRNNFASSEMQTMRAQVDNLTKENEQLKTKVSTLETDKTALEKTISDMEEAAAKEEKKEESIASPKPVSPKPASPKPIEEGEVSNETPQVSVSTEDSTTSPTKEASSDVPVETQPAVEETKSSDEVIPPVATKEAEEPNSSEAMETDAPEPESNAS